MRTIILADNQAIAREGLRFIFARIAPGSPLQGAGSKAELVRQLSQAPDSLVVTDYTLFDLAGPDDLLILSARFPQAGWMLFSDELSLDFMRLVTARSQAFGIVFKDAALPEIESALLALMRSERYICKRAADAIAPNKAPEAERSLLTATEREVLRLIALGKSTKDIAEERFLSAHTVTTHRKNIFRKIDVNNVYEATRYALRAGIIDLADYYI
ncbi:MAG: response regulator transcription factor [Tannerellaceae bacterium]|jgi:DNA-binding NarL/FixJ family response regulator|nr:response regulator transcription factor [Tannerellaceae bacterium]